MAEGEQPRVGATRHCASSKGERWAERCTAWEPGRALGLEFQSKEQGFPFPMDPMVGGWRLEPMAGNRSRVTVWWSFTTKPAGAELLIVPMMAGSIRRSFPKVIEAMARDADASWPSSSSSVSSETRRVAS